ncbi:hypothetical protein FACS189452_01880 [Bacteroidia bacterium]|nr:hypothetical protein FACS189452_01880 [Bacteroidia bacterium]GHT81418.1 hypothetical protein FACS189467_5440 [Bacteroidia bacterium]
METLLKRPINNATGQGTPTHQRISGVEYDTNGNPVWLTVEETFDQVDALLVERYGGAIRNQLNDIRTQYGMPTLP